MRLVPALLNRCGFDLEMSEAQEWLGIGRRSRPGHWNYGGPRRIYSAAIGIPIEPLAGTDPWGLWSMSMRARSATGTCRCPG